MAELKTKQTSASVKEFLQALPDEQQRKDATAVAKLMQEVTGEKPAMWGGSIVGFGSYHYKYETGHEGDCCAVGFAPRKGQLSLYVLAGFDGKDELLAKLGKHKTGKSCLYIKRLSDVDLPTLRELVKQSVEYARTHQARCGE